MQLLGISSNNYANHDTGKSYAIRYPYGPYYGRPEGIDNTKFYQKTNEISVDDAMDMIINAMEKDTDVIDYYGYVEI